MSPVAIHRKYIMTPYVLDVITPYTEHVLPFIPQKKSAMEILTK